MKRPFKTLHFISDTIDVIGWIVIGLSVAFVPVMFFLDIIEDDTLLPVVIVGGCLLIAIFGVLIVGLGQSIKLFLKIEKNTRKPCNHTGESGKYCTKCGEEI
jgi:nucleoside recognition membrane protein YjiH